MLYKNQIMHGIHHVLCIEMYVATLLFISNTRQAIMFENKKIAQYIDGRIICYKTLNSSI